MSTYTKLSKAVRNQKIIDALGSQLKVATTITLDGTSYKAKDLQQQFQSEIDAAKATQSAKNAWQQAVLAEEKLAPQTTLLRNALRAYLIGTYGAKSAMVAEFGLTPKEAKIDVATKAHANATRKATVAKRAAPAAAPEAAPAPVVPAVNGTTPKTTATA